jgi:hypothetical protein
MPPSSSVTAMGSEQMTRGGFGDLRRDLRGDGLLTGHPEQRAVGAGAGDLEHLRPHGREHEPRRLLSGTHAFEPSCVVLARVVRGAGFEERLQAGEVVAHVANGLLERHAPRVVDDRSVVHAESEGETPADGGLRRECL